ncbi:MAG TPA: hypothetical protein QGH10_14820 [Armatimonadota bacterium]|nr:hypothetical protein [Armatimonadota bacterium]
MDPPIVDAGESALWTAPNEENMVYEVPAPLPDDEDAYSSDGGATCLVATGGRSTLRAPAEDQPLWQGGNRSLWKASAAMVVGTTFLHVVPLTRGPSGA